MPTKTIHLTYYAHLRDNIGIPVETRQTAAGTARELYSEVKTHYNIDISEELLRVSVNDIFTSWQTELKTGDSVVFITPVSGG